MYVTLKSFVVYFRNHFQPFLYFTDENNFKGEICLIDKLRIAGKSNKISPYVFLFVQLFVVEDGSAGNSFHGG